MLTTHRRNPPEHVVSDRHLRYKNIFYALHQRVCLFFFPVIVLISFKMAKFLLAEYFFAPAKPPIR